jgi:phage-related protein
MEEIRVVNRRTLLYNEGQTEKYIAVDITPNLYFNSDGAPINTAFNNHPLWVFLNRESNLYYNYDEFGYGLAFAIHDFANTYINGSQFLERKYNISYKQYATYVTYGAFKNGVLVETYEERYEDYAYTQYEPSGYVYLTCPINEPFANKDFYIILTDTADGQGGIITSFRVVKKTKDIETKVRVKEPPRVDPRWRRYTDLTQYKPIYGSSVSFKSRLNYIETIDNSLKVLPSSENNLVSKFNFKFLLLDFQLGDLLRTIELAEGTRILKFADPSNMYKDVVGLVEDYSFNKINSKLNEVDIVISSYFKAPIFNWKTSSFLNLKSPLDYSSSKSYNKYDFVYFDPSNLNPDYSGELNKIDNFWFAKEDLIATSGGKFDTTKWTKVFNYECKLPFSVKNKFDFYQMDYKNSFVQNIKHKENSNSLKQFEFRLENITDAECRSILFFLEKKCGYRRFFYFFPFMFDKNKIFICIEWTHTFKYYNCNDITAVFVEDPIQDISKFNFIDSSYRSPYPQFLTSQ